MFVLPTVCLAGWWELEAFFGGSFQPFNLGVSSLIQFDEHTVQVETREDERLEHFIFLEVDGSDHGFISFHG